MMITMMIAITMMVLLPPALSLAMPRILLTGGSGYIGSHTAVELLCRGYDVVVVDDLSNSKELSCRRAIEIASKQLTGGKLGELSFRRCDIRSEDDLSKVLSEFPDVRTCIHFAGLKAVGESSVIPTEYYDVNVGGSVNLLKCMKRHGVRNVVFSSSATVYGDPQELPVTEKARSGVTSSVYGRTKWFVEEIIRDEVRCGDGINALILRYFNPIGAHPSGEIGEDPKGELVSFSLLVRSFVPVVDPDLVDLLMM